MSRQRCGKCKGHGHNRLTCGKTTPQKPSALLLAGRNPSHREAQGLGPGATVAGAKQELAFGALYGAYAASKASKPNPRPRPPAATISHTPVSDRDAQFTVYAEVDGQRVGQATFEPTLHGDDAMITMIHVHEDFRRRGIAQQMWEKVKELGFEPVHSLRRKPDGEAFAAAVGGPTPPNLALITPDMPAEEKQALNAAVWDWYASRPTKRLPRHLQKTD